jgi:hypothetical protein
MDFIEINDSVDYENIGYVNENGIFEEANTVNANGNRVGNFIQPSTLVDNQSFYRDFAKQNPQYQPQPKPILKHNNSTSVRPQQLQQPQKKVTYDDILSSLNMKVINGKLQIIRGDDPTPPPMQRGRGGPVHPSSSHAQTYTKQNEFYNKFLQAQQQQQIVEEEVELTPEQIAAQQQYHKRLMMIQYIKNQQQRIRVGQVKSKKMKFV